MQAPPYALLAKPAIKKLKDLKGKVISLGGPKDITKIYVERMLAPHGVKPGEFDMVFAGATSARASALQAGAVDAAILLPPFNFHAVAAGFNELGLTVDYAPELPFSGTVVNRNWAGQERAGAAADPGRASQERGVVLRSEEPRRGRRDDGRGEQDQDRGRGEVLRLLRQGQVLRADRRHLADQDERASCRPCSSSAICRRPFDTEQLVLPGVTKIGD